MNSEDRHSGKNSLIQPRRYQRGGSYLVALGALVLLYYGSYFALNGQPTHHLQLIAHRGAWEGRSGDFPENTMAAFQNAVGLGADWLEMDVQMTKDGQLVVIHDETVDRTTNGSGRIADLTLAEIRTFDAGQGEQIPTFKEVIGFARDAGISIIPEAKLPHLYPGLEAKMTEEIKEAGYTEHTVIQSFDAAFLVRLRALDPNISICALHSIGDFNLDDPQPANAGIVAPMAEMVILYPWMIRQAHKAGHQVYAWFWITEHPLLIHLLLAFGVDGIMADDMATLAEISEH